MQLLGHFQKTGTGTNLRKTRSVTFMGGAATATQTTIFGSQAGEARVPSVWADNADGATVLTSPWYIPSAKIVAGVGCVVVHQSALGLVGSPKIRFRW